MSSRSDKPQRRRGRRRRRRRQRQQKRFDGLRRKIDEGPLRDEKKVVFIEPKGHVKMSEVLEAFVEPYVDEVDSEEDYRKLLGLAIAAWNVALFPEDKRQDMIDQVIESVSAGDDVLKANLTEIMSELTERKQKYFRKYRRMIVDFELRDTGRGYELQVVSTLEDTPRR